MPCGEGQGELPRQGPVLTVIEGKSEISGQTWELTGSGVSPGHCGGALQLRD